jgi:hypothetical protein
MDHDTIMLNFICIGVQMLSRNEELTLLEFICSPFIARIVKKPFFGRAYVLRIDLFKVTSTVYQTGAVLGCVLQHKLNILTKLFFVRGTREYNEVDSFAALCRKNVKKDLEEFEGQFQCEPATFDDFILYWEMEKTLLRRANIRMKGQDAYEAYLHGDKKIKKIFDQKLELKYAQELMVMLASGIFFGSSFPELTQAMYQKAWEDDRNRIDTWAHGLVIPEEIKVMSLEEAKKTNFQIVEDYASKYYPELVDALA